MKEGAKGAKKAKFYVIQAGDCVLEKKLQSEINQISHTKKALLLNSENIQISIIGIIF